MATNQIIQTLSRDLATAIVNHDPFITLLVFFLGQIWIFHQWFFYEKRFRHIFFRFLFGGYF